MTSKAPADTSGPGEPVGSEADLSSRDVAAHLAILNLEGEYARTWDTVDPEGWAGLFTREGVFEMLPVGNLPAGFYRGARRSRSFAGGSTRVTAGST